MVKYRVNLERGVWCPSNVKKIHFCFINPWRTIRFFVGLLHFLGLPYSACLASLRGLRIHDWPIVDL